MTTIYLDITAFRALFPQFANPINYTDATLQLQWESATTYITSTYSGCNINALTLKQQALALNLMLAHLMALATQIAAGSGTGLVTASTIDKISVTLQPPPQTTQWQWWLNQTPYGQQLLALLQVRAVGGFYYGGSPSVVGAFKR